MEFARASCQRVREELHEMYPDEHVLDELYPDEVLDVGEMHPDEIPWDAGPPGAP